MKNGLITENGELIYYENGKPKHAGVIEIGDAVYYISSDGRAVKGRHIVHRSMANGILPHGTYTFGDDYTLIEGSYIPPRKEHRKTASAKKSKRRSGKHSGKKARLRPLLLCTALLACLIAVMLFIDFHHTHHSLPESADNRSTVSLQARYSLPTYTEPVLLCSEGAKKAYDHSIAVADVIASGDPYRPFVFRYNLGTEEGMLYLSEYPDMRSAKSFPLTANNNVLSIDNLKVSTQYYYKAVIGGQESGGSFKTAQSTRFITIPGVKNTRDIGGYTTLDGKTVRQGLLIRGTEIDGLVVPSYSMPTRAQADVQSTFGFVYDFDLRETTLFSGIYQSPLGANVGHKFYQSPQYGQIFNQNWQPALYQIFSDLADPAKYPMYLHCTWGQDRTGTVVFLLQGLLNMSLEDMLYDYRLSAFNNAAIASSESMDAVIFGLEAYQGDTIQKKIEDYFISFVGITPQQIDSIRKIFLEE